MWNHWWKSIVEKKDPLVPRAMWMCVQDTFSPLHFPHCSVFSMSCMYAKGRGAILNGEQQPCKRECCHMLIFLLFRRCSAWEKPFFSADASAIISRQPYVTPSMESMRWSEDDVTPLQRCLAIWFLACWLDSGSPWLLGHPVIVLGHSCKTVQSCSKAVMFICIFHIACMYIWLQSHMGTGEGLGWIYCLCILLSHYSTFLRLSFLFCPLLSSSVLFFTC